MSKRARLVVALQSVGAAGVAAGAAATPGSPILLSATAAGVAAVGLAYLAALRFTASRTPPDAVSSSAAPGQHGPRPPSDARRLDAMLLAAVDNFPDAVALFDSDDRLLMCNALYTARYLPAPVPGGWTGKTFTELLEANLERDLVANATHRERFLSTRLAWHRQASGAPLQVSLTDGRWLILRDFSLDQGGTVVVLSDVTALHASQDALRTSDDRLRDFADVAADWFWETDAEQRFRFLSPRFEALTGMPVADYIGRTRDELTGTDPEQPGMADLNQHMRGREPFRDLVYSRTGADDQRHHFRISGKPVIGTGGALLGYRGAGTDVTEATESASRARAAEQRLVDALESIGDGVALYDRAERLVLCNSVYREVFVKDTPRGLMQTSARFEEVLRSNLLAGTLAEAHRCERWIGERLACFRRGLGEPTPVRRSDGKWTQARDFRTRDGGTVVVVSDISLLKQREEQVRQSEQRFRAFAEASGDWFWESGPDGRLSYVSGRGPIDGGKAPLVTGFEIAELTDERTDTTRWHEHRRALAARAPFVDFQWRVAGRREYISISGAPLTDGDGAFAGYRGVARDVSAQRRLEELLRTLAGATNERDLSAFLRLGVRALAALFEARYALVAMHEPTRPGVLRTVVLWAGDHFASNIEFASDDQRAQGRAADQAPSTRQAQEQRAPIPALLNRLGATGYLGVPILGADGQALGVLAVADPQALRPNALIEPLAEVVAGRFAAELERERAQNRLQASERSLRGIFDNAPVALAIRDAQGRFLQASPAFGALYEVAPEALRGRLPSEVLSPERGHAVERADRQLLDSSQPLRSEEQVNGPDGPRTFLVQRFPIPDTAGKVAGLGVAATEISDLKAAEDRARAAYELLRTSVESLSDGLAMYDANDQLMLCNEPHRRLYAPIAHLLVPGADRREMLQALMRSGHFVAGLPRDSGTFLHQRLGAVRTGTGMEVKTREGHWLELRDYPTSAGGTIVLSIDITQRKRADQALAEYREHLEDMVRERTAALETAQSEVVKNERLATIGRLAATVSHELRNPLGAIRNAVYLLRRGSNVPEPRQARYLELIDRELGHSERIIDDLLETTRVKDPHLETVCVAALIAEVRERHGVAPGIDIQAAPRLDGMRVQADPVQLRQVLANLIVNAAQAMPDGGTVLVDGWTEGDTQYVRVTDRGRGIADDLRERIFEPLFTTRVKGNGLGLWISREIMRRHGGDLVLCDTGISGTTFALELPVQQPLVASDGACPTSDLAQAK